jgi:L-threonylcarbamoyladenylate synthase
MNKTSKIGVDITQAKQLLDVNHVIAIPTETVYGLAGNAFDIKAVSQIFAIKKRPSFDPLIVHTHSIEALKQFVTEIPEHALLLARAFWPGPLTLLLQKKK